MHRKEQLYSNWCNFWWKTNIDNCNNGCRFHPNQCNTTGANLCALVKNQRQNWILLSQQELTFSGKSPQIQGFFYLERFSKKFWKKTFFTLRRSGLYRSTKGQETVGNIFRFGAIDYRFSHNASLNRVLQSVLGNQDPQHLKCIADLDVSNVYKVVDGCKLYGAPTNFNFCIKVESGFKQSFQLGTCRLMTWSRLVTNIQIIKMSLFQLLTASPPLENGWGNDRKKGLSF